MSEASKNTTEKDGTRKKKDAKRKKGISLFGFLTAGLFVIILLLIAGDVYLWKAQYFLNHFYQNTTINGNDCSDLQVDDVKALIQDSVDDYEIVITTLEGEDYILKGPELELKYVDDNAVDILMKSQKPLLWIQKNEESAKYEIIPNTWYNEEKMKEMVGNLPFMDKEQMTQPQDAHIADTEEGYVIVPEVEGNTLDVDKVFETLVNAIDMGEKEVSLVDEECYLKPEIYQDSEELKNEVDTLNKLTQAQITYTVCEKDYVIDRNVLKSWLIKDENGAYCIDDAKMKEFIQKLAKERDSYGGTRQFKTKEGKTITLKTNEYGWKVNQEKSLEELVKAVADGFHGNLELVYDHTALGVGKNDLGGTYIEISISKQKMWYYQNGKVVVETKIVSGNESKKQYATPRNGCWVVSAKEKNYTITGPLKSDGQPEYKEATKLWIAFNDEIGIYDKTRKNNKFGGTIYKKNGSYGSIQTPIKAMEKIYNAVEIGTPVIVY